MSDTPAPRRKPILRKEVVETKTWGEVVVRQFLGTDKMEISAAFTPVDDASLVGETDVQRRVRYSVEYDRMLCAVLQKSVTAKGSDEPLYDFDEWNAWQVQIGNDDADTVQISADLMKLTQKALGMNGYKLLPAAGEKVGEDVAKNA
jgi:hypothetical protein